MYGKVLRTSPAPSTGRFSEKNPIIRVQNDEEEHSLFDRFFFYLRCYHHSKFNQELIILLLYLLYIHLILADRSRPLHMGPATLPRALFARRAATC